ncbi:DUF397 domain-containing protein [Streptomyces sp. NPDC055897]
MMLVENGVPADRIEGARWQKARASIGAGECVEMARLAEGAVAVRNSRFPAGPALVFTPGEWSAFLSGAKGNEFDAISS